MKSDSELGSHGTYFITEEGNQYLWSEISDFEQDEAAGHGTHTAGSSAGATLNNPAETVTCSNSDVLGCVGGCISSNPSSYLDDIGSSYSQIYFQADLDRLCPSSDCDGYEEEVCLGDDIDATLTDHGGMAQGAKLAIFDVFLGDIGLASLAGNGLWVACLEAGCKVHSNSYGSDDLCGMSETAVSYDDFMYNVRGVLLVLAISTQNNA